MDYISCINRLCLCINVIYTVFITVTGQIDNFQCHDNSYISMSLVCDQHSDCNDSSDEDWCTPVDRYNATLDTSHKYGKF